MMHPKLKLNTPIDNISDLTISQITEEATLLLQEIYKKIEHLKSNEFAIKPTFNKTEIKNEIEKLAVSATKHFSVILNSSSTRL